MLNSSFAAFVMSNQSATTHGNTCRAGSIAAVLCLALPLLFAPLSPCQSRPVEVSVGWTYSNSDQSDGYAPVNGYYTTITWDVRKNLGLALSHSTAWGRYGGDAIAQRIFLAGATCYLATPQHPIRPFVQPFAGVTRVSYLRTVEYQPTVQVGGGVEARIARGLSLEVTPAGYSYNHASVGGLHNFVAGLGLNYTFTRRH